MSEAIEIEVRDKIAPAIRDKLLNIAQSALEGATSIEKLNTQIGKLNSSSITKLARAQELLGNQAAKNNIVYLKQETALNKAVEAENKAAAAGAKLAAQLARTNTAIDKNAISTERLAAAESKATESAAKAATAIVTLSNAQQKGITAATQSAAALEKLAAAQSNSVAAAQRAAQAVTQAAQAQALLTAAQANAATAQARAGAASTQAASATQRLAQATSQAAAAQTRAQTATTAAATAQTRLAIAASQAEAAQSRAALAALRLQNAQAKASTGASGYANSLLSVARNAAATIGAGLSVSYLVGLGDAYTTLQNKLQNVTESQSQVNKLTKELFDLANRTRAPVEETATAFTRFDRALKILGKSQQESLRLTETVNKALVVSGATSTESASALLQLSQAFNSGKLQGDEFRAVSENLPIVLDAISKATGTPINQLKKFASEGKITSKVLFDAFALIGPQIDKTFAKTLPTVGQAFEVLKNNVLQSFGEFNKAIGFTQGLAKAILFLSDNVRALALVAVVTGAALLVAFGPALLAAITTAGVALIAFALTNPVGLLLIGITAVIAAFAIFSDKIELIKNTNTTFADVFVSAFNIIQELATSTLKEITDGFTSLTDYISPSLDGLGETFTNIYGFIKSITLDLVNGVIGLFVGTRDAIRVIFNNFPALFEFAFAKVVNFGAAAVEAVVNYWQVGARAISKIISKISPDVSEQINSVLKEIEIKIPRIDVSEGAKTAASQVSKAFGDAFKRDYINEAKTAIIEGAKLIAANRAETQRLANKGSAGALRGRGKDSSGGSDDGAKAAKSRAQILANVTRELDKQLTSFGLLEEARKVQQSLDEIDIQLAGKNFAKLRPGEKEILKNKFEQVEANKRVQASQDAIYESINGPQKQYEAALAASQILLQKTYISQTNFNEAVARAAYEYERATNPLADYNQSIKDQNALFGLGLRERQAASQVQQIVNAAASKGKVISDETQAAIFKENVELQKRNELQTAYDQIIAANAGAKEALITQQNALNAAYINGAIGLTQYQTGLVQVQTATANLALNSGFGTFEDAATSALGRIVEGYKNGISGISEAFSGLFTTVIDGFANSVGRAIVYSEDLGSAIRDVAKSALSELISSLVKVGLQYVINSVLAKTVSTTTLATTTAASVASAAAVAAAWAPAAAAVSLATFGANAIPADIGIASSYALSKVLASTTGFKEGGYTGNGGISSVSGVVHGQEFVVNAAGTAANRSTLERMNKGERVGNAGGGTPQITIEDHTTGGVNFEAAPGLNEGEIRLIARDEINKNGPRVVAATMSNPNSAMSKAMSRNTTAQRAR